MGKTFRNVAYIPDVDRPSQFNLETPDADIFKEHTRIYRSISSSLSPPSFQLQVLLCVPELTPNQVLSYVAPDSSRAPVDPTPKYILLESWSLDFTPHQVQYHYADDRVDVAPPTIYKLGISLFRSIFTLLRMLPAWKLARRLRRPAGNFAIQVRVEAMENRGSDGILGFGKPRCTLNPDTCSDAEWAMQNPWSRTYDCPKTHTNFHLSLTLWVHCRSP